MKIAGVVIFFNPDSSVTANIASYYSMLDKLYIIDNSHNPNKNLVKKINSTIDNIDFFEFSSNTGIAYALNFACKQAVSDGYDWILTMDQDSRFEENHFKQFIDFFEQKTISPDVAIFSPYYRIEQYTGVPEHQKQLVYIENTMTSGNILNLKLYQETDGFNEDFFIDEVDHEYCEQVKVKKYKIIRNNYIQLKHCLGNSRIHNLMGFKFMCSHHSYIRRYYISRNRLYMVKLYPYLWKNYLFRNWVSLAKIILFEDDKFRKIKSLLNGVFDFYMGIKGKKEFTY